MNRVRYEKEVPGADGQTYLFQLAVEDELKIYKVAGGIKMFILGLNPREMLPNGLTSPSTSTSIRLSRLHDVGSVIIPVSNFELGVVMRDVDAILYSSKPARPEVETMHWPDLGAWRNTP